MVEKLLELGGNGLVLPIILAIVGAAIVKGFYSLRQSRRASRRDFLELWSNYNERDDFWVEVAVRHIFDEYLPAKLIRRLLLTPNPARALLEVSTAWPLLRLSESGEICWKAARHSSPEIRRRERWLFGIAYFVLAGIGLVLAFSGMRAGLEFQASVIVWAYVCMFLFAAFFALAKESELASANVSVPRWLGLG